MSGNSESTKPKRSREEAGIEEEPCVLKRSARDGRGNLRDRLSAAFKNIFWQVGVRHRLKPLCAKPKLAKLLHSNPNIWLLEEFITENQMERLEKVIPSWDNFQASFSEDVTGLAVFDEHRTSKFHSFSKSQTPIVRDIESKAANATGLFHFQVEPPQVVKYEPGEKHGLHHDAGAIVEEEGGITIKLPPSDLPLRVATVFLYLNDMPPGEGKTVFPELNLSVTPKRRSALVFANITEDGSPDPRTVHEARPPSSQRKVGMNLWLTDREHREN